VVWRVSLGVSNLVQHLSGVVLERMMIAFCAAAMLMKDSVSSF
jgi:hypothetical protein